MPLIKRDKPRDAAAPEHESIEMLTGELRDPDPERRWSAVRRLGERSGSAEHLAAALAGEQDPRIVEAIFTSLIRLGGAESARFLFPLLRSDVAAWRLGAVEALQTMPAALAEHIEELLRDRDSDVRIFAVELTRKMPPGHAARLLSATLDREDHPNVCAAAIDVLAEVGSADAIPCLKRCRARFAKETFLLFSIALAIESISRDAT